MHVWLAGGSTMSHSLCFFFSSRRRHTRCSRDWSSDVCSSDLRKVLEFEELARAFGYSLGVEDLRQREIAVRHGRVPAPAKAGRPDSYGRGRERAMRVALPGGELRITPQHYQRLIRKIEIGRAHV